MKMTNRISRRHPRDEAPLCMIASPADNLEVNEDGELVCVHPEAYLDPACCISVGSSGHIECGCGGRDSVVCPANNCTGIQDHEVDGLFDSLQPEPPEYEHDDE